MSEVCRASGMTMKRSDAGTTSTARRPVGTCRLAVRAASSGGNGDFSSKAVSQGTKQPSQRTPSWGNPSPVHACGLVCRPRTAAAGGRPQAGLEVVEKLLTSKASKGLPMRDACVASMSVLSRVGILGKQGKVILEGPGQAFQESASLVSRCERWAADDAGLGVAPHARHQ